MRFLFTLAVGMLLILQVQADVRAPQLIYEIFTRSFQDSNGDGIGDLDGVRSRLDYISSLGADAIWLTPIFQSPSYHGYDISDYQTIKSDYGDLASLTNLINDAHSRGIKVYLDVAVNHTSNQHPWFSNHDDYLWASSPQHWPFINIVDQETPESHWYPLDGAYYFSSFGADMPDLNWKNPDVLSKIEEVFHYWASIGVDGFRLDAAKFLIKGPNGEQNQPGTHEIWKQIAASVHQQYPSVYFIGEIWDSAANLASYYGNGDELDAAFDFPIEDAIRTSITSGNASAMLGALNDQLATQKNPFFAAPFAGNHDMERLASVLGEDIGKQKLAAASFLSLPGTPVIYYGDEIGIPQSDANGDLAKRSPMIWTEDEGHGFTTADPWNDFSTADSSIAVDAQESNPQSLLNYYKGLIAKRKSTPALSEGVLSNVTPQGSTAVSFQRTAPDGTNVAILLNFGSQALSDRFIPLKLSTRSVSLNPKLIFGKAKISITNTRAGGLALQVSGVGPRQAIIVQF
jgi:alpha-amylase